MATEVVLPTSMETRPCRRTSGHRWYGYATSNWVHNGDDFWDLLINKRNGQCRLPKDRYNIDAWYGPGKSGHVGTQHGYFLEDLDLSHMCASFWSMTKQVAELMDPQQRLTLEVVYEALENAGEKNWRGRNIGCYVGIFGEDWPDMDSKDVQNMHLYHC